MSWTRGTHIDSRSWRWSYHGCMVSLSPSPLSYSARCARYSYRLSIYAHA